MPKLVRNRPLVQFGDNVRTLRKEQGYSQEAFAEVVGVHRTYIGGIERGERNPTLITMIRILEALDVSFEALLCGVLEGSRGRVSAPRLKVAETRATYRKRSRKK